MIEREKIDSIYKWNVEDIFVNDLTLENSIAEAKNFINGFDKYKGTVTSSSEMLFTVLEYETKVKRAVENIFAYSFLKKDEDTRNTEYQNLFSKANKLKEELENASAFIQIEILKEDRNTIKKYINENSNLFEYKRYINSIIRNKDHMLSDKEEEILRGVASLAKAPEQIFSMKCFADIKFPNITLSNGEVKPLSNGVFPGYMLSDNRELRRLAHESYYNTYLYDANTYAAMLSSRINYNIFFAKQRKYNSALEYSLYSEEINPVIYDSLLKATNNKLSYLHRYMSLRKKLLGYDTLNIYDTQFPIVKDNIIQLSYEEVVEKSKLALKCLGEKYIADFSKGYESGWIDLGDIPGKTSTQYSFSGYDTHPYVCVIYNNSLASASTLVHEMGHAMHYYYSNKNNNYVNSKFTIFVSEVLSLLNDWLFIGYLKENAKTKDERLQYVNQQLEQFRKMFYSTTMYAEFQKITHEYVENGQSITSKFLNYTNSELYKKYYGQDVEVDNLIAVDWARYPHFYFEGFYLFKYATGLAAAVTLAKRLKNGDHIAQEAFMELVSSGCTDEPVELLKKAGVDMSTPTPIEEALDEFNKLLDEFEELTK